MHTFFYLLWEIKFSSLDFLRIWTTSEYVIVSFGFAAALPWKLLWIWDQSSLKGNKHGQNERKMWAKTCFEKAVIRDVGILLFNSADRYQTCTTKLLLAQQIHISPESWHNEWLGTCRSSTSMSSLIQVVKTELLLLNQPFFPHLIRFP